MAHEQPLYNEADHQLIEDYLDGILSEEDRKMVEDRLQSDSDFAAQFQLHQDIEGVLDAHEKQTLKQGWATLIDEAEEEMKASTDAHVSPLKVASKSPKKSSFRWLKVAAIALMFLLPAALYLGGFFHSNPASPQELVAQNFVAPNDLIEVSRGGDDVVKSVVALEKSIQKAYQSKAYQQALDSLEVLQKISLEDSLDNISQVYFSMGICRFLLKDYDEAAHNFLKVNPEDGIQSKTNWYLALTYLQLSDIEKAQTLLSKIAAAENVKQERKEQARELLKGLKD